MQTRSPRFSLLRRKLARFAELPRRFLHPLLDEKPMIKGTLYPLRRKCGKPSCRCARGQLHETMMLSASIAGKTKLWTIPAERVENIREMTERYRHFRRARTEFVKLYRQRLTQILGIINEIERVRKKDI
jgi:hypothetical protein